MIIDLANPPTSMNNPYTYQMYEGNNIVYECNRTTKLRFGLVTFYLRFSCDASFAGKKIISNIIIQFDGMRVTILSKQNIWKRCIGPSIRQVVSNGLKHIVCFHNMLSSIYNTCII